MNKPMIITRLFIYSSSYVLRRSSGSFLFVSLRARRQVLQRLSGLRHTRALEVVKRALLRHTRALEEAPRNLDRRFATVKRYTRLIQKRCTIAHSLLDRSE